MGEMCGRDGAELAWSFAGKRLVGGHDVGGVSTPSFNGSPSVRGWGTLNIYSDAVEPLERAAAFFVFVPK